MRKFLFCLLATFCLVATFGSNSFQSEGNEIRLTTVHMPGKDFDTTARSAVPEVSAYLDVEMEQIEVQFAGSIGEIWIGIIDEVGQTVSSYICDTEMEWVVYLPTPQSGGIYTLQIETSSLIYSGSFLLRRPVFISNSI